MLVKCLGHLSGIGEAVKRRTSIRTGGEEERDTHVLGKIWLEFLRARGDEWIFKVWTR